MNPKFENFTKIEKLTPKPRFGLLGL